MSKIPEVILQAGCTAYGAEFLNGSGSLGDGIEAAYFAIHDHDDWARPGPEAWSGEGVPPVSAVCIFNTEKVYDEEWHPVLPRHEDIEVTIVAHVVQPISGMTVAVFTFQCEGGIQVEMGVAELFKPKPTAEQIAEEKRAHEICEIRTLLEAEPLNSTLLAYAIHAAGYRKQVQP
jgi:hypothetical protein